MSAIYAAPGYLVYSRGQMLVVQKWDAEGLDVTGPAIPLTQIFADPGVEGAPRVSVSANGTLAYSNRASLWTVDLQTGIGARIPGASGAGFKPRRFTGDGRELRLVPLPDRRAGHMVIHGWTSLLR